MTNGNDVLEFEEKHFGSLSEKFIQEYKNAWDEFVHAEFSAFEQHVDDFVHDSKLNFEMDGHDYYVDC
jgi:hypothetical protein